MLSRIAESMFWIGRYVERAEDTARILEVVTQLVLEEGAADEDATCRDLLSIMGIEDVDPDVRVDTTTVMEQLAYDPGSPASIAAALGAARESARRARETLTVPMWEAINTTYRAIPTGRFRSLRPPTTFTWVRDRASLINGHAEATMSRDDGWLFLMLGRSIERADMTARLIATAAVSSGGGSSWITSLRACGAYDAFLRTYKGVETERTAAEFLLLDRLFPRSVVHALNKAETSLDRLETQGQRAGITNDAQRLLGRTRAELEYRSLTDVVADLPTEMERLQRTCAAATDAITRRFFAGSEATEWQGVLA